MANSTVRVNTACVDWGNDTILLPPVDSVAQTFYPGGLVARNSSGAIVKCDDTAGISFLGLIADTAHNVTIQGTETAAELLANQAKKLFVRRPWRFAIDIASATATDVGRAVYAKYDNEAAYTSSNSILLGWVDQVLSSTRILVNPL